ncbi:hypothetical protein ADUPG1_013690, partial [Aduncisulcus paluster]
MSQYFKKSPPRIHLKSSTVHAVELPIEGDLMTITSSSAIEQLCYLGRGGFSATFLVKVDGIPIPCVLKEMFYNNDKKMCRKEFLIQRELFNNPKCFNRIPRPLYILDVEFKGVYGFIMEYCAGGHVWDFARSWCVVEGFEHQGEEEEEDSSSLPFDDSDSSLPDLYIDPMTMNPVKVAALCVGMIECLDDVFTAKPSLVHRDIKPDNFLVRVDPKDGECTIVLSDLGLSRFQGILSTSQLSLSFDLPSSKPSLDEIQQDVKKRNPQKAKRSICGTLVYNSYESLREGIQTQKSDAYSLGISIFAMFLGQHPFLGFPIFRYIDSNGQFILRLIKFLEDSSLSNYLIDSPLFESLRVIEGGKYQPVHECLQKVFEGLTQLDADDRMSVHKARMMVRDIKHLLPKIGEGWQCPTIKDVIKEQNRIFEEQEYSFGYRASKIFSDSMDRSEIDNPIDEVISKDKSHLDARISTQDVPRGEDDVSREIIPTFISEGNFECIPISRDDPSSLCPMISNIKAMNATLNENDPKYDQSLNIQKMFQGEYYNGYLTHISLPFSPSTALKGVYICVGCDMFSNAPPSHLTFTFTSSRKQKTSKKYNFSKIDGIGWFSLPVDLTDVVLCEIEGKGLGTRDYFIIYSLVFFREESPHESIDRQSKESTISSQWRKAELIYPKFIVGGFVEAIPTSNDDPAIVTPTFDRVLGKDDLLSPKSKCYDHLQLSVQEMLKGQSGVYLSHLSIPFSSPSPLKGVYVCLHNYCSSPSLLFTFTHSNGKQSSKKYEFTRPKLWHEWFFLTIDLPDVVLCEINGKGRWEEKNSRRFYLGSLVFIQGSDIPALPSDSSKVPKQSKYDKLTLTSASAIDLQCIIGHGGFGEVLLVKVNGIPIPCVLKKMLRKTDEKVMKDCQMEFNVQRKLFNDPKCLNRIPRPLYIVNLLDAKFRGVYGFLMEYCIGGSVKDFSVRWCSDGKYADLYDSLYIDPMTLNPVKVAALCVGMIECLDDVFLAYPSLVHRDIKPDNFLVRVDPDSKKCTVVLSDLGLVQIMDSILSSTSSKCFVDFDSSKSSKTKKKRKTSKQRPSRSGTLVYNSYETLQEGTQNQNTDGYSLGMSILALFLGVAPFVTMPGYREVAKQVRRGELEKKEIMEHILQLMKDDRCQNLSRAPLFKSLKTLDGGRYKPIFNVFDEVFKGLTHHVSSERMSVHQAREKVEHIKYLLPEIGDGWKCPSIKDCVKNYLSLHGTPKPLIAPPYNAQRKAYPKSQKPTRVVDHVEDRDPEKPPRKEEEEEEKEEEEEEKEEERSGSDDERRSYLESSISDGPVPLCQDSL